MSSIDAKLPIGSVIGRSPCLDPIDVAVIDSHAITDPQVEVGAVLDDLPAARIESHGDAVSRLACPCLFSISFPTTAPPIAPAMVAAVFPRPLPIWWPITPPAMPPITVPALTGLVVGRAIDISMASTWPSSARPGPPAIATLPLAPTSTHTDIQKPNR